MKRALCALLLTLCACAAPEPEEAQASFFAMNTYMTMTAYGANAQAAVDRAQARIEALESGQVGAAALDVLEQESGLYYADLKTVPIPNHDLALLKAFPNVIVTPHTAFYTEEAVEHMVAGTVKGLLACEQGGENPYLVQG